MMKRLAGRSGMFLLLLILEITLLFTAPVIVTAENAAADTSDSEMRPSELYARYAVLMDAETGRILFPKAETPRLPWRAQRKS